MATPSEALAPVLRTGRLSRHRIAEIVCPTGHRLLDVIRVDPKWARPTVTMQALPREKGEPLEVAQTASGREDFAAVMLFRPGPGEIVGEAEEIGEITAGQLHGSGRRRQLVWWFRGHGAVEASCRCDWWLVDLTWVAAEIRTGRKRLPVVERDIV